MSGNSKAKLLKSGRLSLYPVLVLALLISAVKQTASAMDYTIEVRKSEQQLELKRGGQIIKRFRVAYGKGANGTKQRLGDNKTPSGQYKIIDFKLDSKFHYFMQINYPSLLDAWYGYKNNLITSREFKQIALAHKNNELPPQNTALGGYIGIHGLGEGTEEMINIHNKYNWTEGCIALNNEEIDELRKYVSVGTPIIIKE